MAIYGPPSYQMGEYDDQDLTVPAANAPVTPAQAAAARVELAKMKRALTGWLKYRAVNDAVAAGRAAAVPGALFKRPGAKPPTVPGFAPGFRQARQVREQRMAANLHRLLGEIFDPSQLPNPSSPNAAVQLAQLAVSGKLPGESASPTAVGFVWLWPAVIVVGIIAVVIAQKIRSDAQTAQEAERLACIESGKCTDYGFWLKLGGAAAVAWFAWDKLGGREKVAGLKGRASTGRR